MPKQELIEKNKKRLEEEKVRLEGLLSKIANPDKAAGDYRARYQDIGNKEDENATEVAMFAESLAEERDLENRLHQVERALERIEKGTYGVCQAGGEEISEKRLEAVPEAETCIEHG